MKIHEITGEKPKKVINEGLALTNTEILHVFRILANKQFTTKGRLSSLFQPRKSP